jgi:nitrogen fixation/metabolism regulation signal transduction histidine kinase
MAQREEVEAARKSLRRARQELNKALDLLSLDVPFTDEERELLVAENEAAGAMLTLALARLRGEVPEEEVEAALAAIEYRRQWGSLWWDNPDDDTIPAPPWIE